MQRCLAGILLLACFLLPAASGCREENVVAARVNGETVTYREVERFEALMRLSHPALEEVWQDPTRRAGLRKELLGLLIETRLIRQEVERLGLEPGLPAVRKETEAWLQGLVTEAYGGSRERFESNRRRLGVPAEDLALPPGSRLRVQALYGHIAAGLAEEDLVRYVEENPEIMEQPAVLLVHRLIFADGAAASHFMDRLKRGEPYSRLEGELLSRGERVEIRPPAWLAPGDPFLPAAARDLLRSLSAGGGGGIVPTSAGAEVYWAADYRPAKRLEFDTVRGEAAVHAGHLLYLEYYCNLWAAAEVSVGE